MNDEIGRLTFDASKGDTHFISFQLANIEGKIAQVFAVHYDGRVVLGDGITPDEASRGFFECLSRIGFSIVAIERKRCADIARGYGLEGIAAAIEAEIGQ